MRSDQDKTGMAAAAELYRLAQAQTLIMAKNRAPRVDQYGKVVPTRAALALVRRDHPRWAQIAASSNQGGIGNG